MSFPQKKWILLLSPGVNVIILALVLIGAGVIPPLLNYYNLLDREIVSAIRTILYIILGVMLGGTVLQYLLIYLESANSPRSPEQEGFDAKDPSRGSERDLKNKEWERFVTDFEKISNRLRDETNNLTKRANLNLAIGVMTTIFAGVGLAFIAFLRSPELNDFSNDNYAWVVTAHYVPRLSFIIFAEIFAYFFLRLYKSGLDDIKYFQNELTNVELKITALKVALTRGKEAEILNLVTAELARVERNFILKKDETTVALEKIKTESSDAKDLLAQISNLLNNLKK
jgi:hypothetical protein